MMKTTFFNSKHYVAYTFLMFVLPVSSVFANEDDPFNDDTNDIAPIDDYLIAVLIAAILVAFFYYAKQRKQQIS